jgi:hypothetical protein
MQSLREILLSSHVPMKQGVIDIPDWTRRIKLDVGMSYNGPMSQAWLTAEPDLLVFGFEPDPTSLASLLNPNNTKRLPGHGDLLEHRHLNHRAFVIPVALGSKTSEVDFYITEGGGCSSIYKPKENFRPVMQTVKVPLFPLCDFFDLLPWADLPRRNIDCIEYLKIDAQGNDLEIVKGLGDHIFKVACITLESESSTYHQCDGNNISAIIDYMANHDFVMVKHPNTDDPTFINKRFEHLAEKIYIYQRG